MRFKTAHAQRNPSEYSEYPCEFSEYPCEYSQYPCEHTAFNVFPDRANAAEPVRVLRVPL